MQGGDISAEVMPRIRMIFEGLVGMPPRESRRGLRPARLLGRQRREFTDPARWQLNEHALRLIWYLAWHSDLAVDVVTHLGAKFAGGLEAYLADLPIGNVVETTPNQHVRDLAALPTVVAILDPDPQRRMCYPMGRGVFAHPDNPAAALQALGLQ